MKKTQLTEVNKTTKTNSIGETETVYEETNNTRWVDYLLPVDLKKEDIIKNWGYDPSKSLETKTRSDIEQNTYVKHENEIYYVFKVLEYPRKLKFLFLERVDQEND